MTSNSKQAPIQVTLTNDKIVTVGKLSWRGYKSVKALLADTVSGPMLREITSLVTGPISGIVSDVLQGIAGAMQPGADADKAQAALFETLTTKWNGESTLAVVLAAVDQLKSSLGKILSEILETSDEFTELLLTNACGMDVNSVSSLPVADIVTLRNAALDVNDLAELLELEKNWWGRVMAVGKACLGTPASTSPGTSTTNIS